MLQDAFPNQRRELVEHLREAGIIRTDRVARAFVAVPREEFVWPGTRRQAYVDSPLPLGATGQTISAPHMVAIMLEELRLAPGHTVLEVGTGSGYNAALIADIVAKQAETRGCVVTIERVHDLVPFAEANLARTSYADIVKVVWGDGTLGYPERSATPLYDRIVVTAAAPRIPTPLERQLRADGVLLAPVGGWEGQTLVRLTKTRNGRHRTEDLGGCIFVPLIGAEGFGGEA
jgi:protein-L-isoaspartate(D-aspartate) O-methyltransferase